MEKFNSFASDQIIITKRQASMIMASTLVFCLFIFIIGFFLGKRALIDDFSSKVTKEALNDQIDFFLTTQSLESSQEALFDTLGTEPVVIDAQDSATPNNAMVSSAHTDVTTPRMFATQRQEKAVMTQDGQYARPQEFPVIDTNPVISTITEAKNPQYAQLIGFGTKQAAQAFVNRLQKHHVSVILKTVISKTASGKQRTWYQAITPTYESTQELQDQVSKIKRLEHIRGNDIKIVYVK